MDRYSRFRGGDQIWSNKTPASNIVNKEFWENSNYFWIKVSGVWKKCITWVKVSGVWKQATPNIKVNGNWT